MAHMLGIYEVTSRDLTTSAERDAYENLVIDKLTTFRTTALYGFRIKHYTYGVHTHIEMKRRANNETRP